MRALFSHHDTTSAPPVSKHKNNDDDDDDNSDDASETSSMAHSHYDRKGKGSGDSHTKEVKEMLDMENKIISFWRALVALMMVFTSVLVIYFAHTFLNQEDMRDFDVGVSSCETYCLLDQVLRTCFFSHCLHSTFHHGTALYA
jgi:hypothetical protein